MHREQLLACVEVNDLQKELQPIAKRIGIEAMRVVLEELEGIRVDFWSYSRRMTVIRRYIQMHYRLHDDGSDNAVELARVLNLRPIKVREYAREGV